ncbi:unnamed protein product [Owenia fusiformis]|uniref:Uncharacterized protein n=1 Tax=Owenia fusiformis TaxID=6347 RepID=A0A8J1TTL3_OWEFU|nr:unnamed protein product [Owenia fusiformis]
MYNFLSKAIPKLWVDNQHIFEALYVDALEVAVSERLHLTAGLDGREVINLQVSAKKIPFTWNIIKGLIQSYWLLQGRKIEYKAKSTLFAKLIGLEPMALFSNLI